MNSIGLDRLYEYLNGIGGCDAQDEWSREWDEAIDTIIYQINEWRKEPVMVVKFQKAILGGKKVLVYDKKETIRQELPLTKEINELFAGRFKMYRKCTMDKNGKLWIGKEVRGHF
ncbi:MAG: hypothetical protein ACLSUP_02645 [Blautia massiliensis (ex Durand et al. 2017)]|uniref:hypothetical protein n=1 Tax=Blautia massiliensis (ex Durand et al. 2017) TaxID=1737424 RepID=UPI003993DB54